MLSASLKKTLGFALQNCQIRHFFSSKNKTSEFFSLYTFRDVLGVLPSFLAQPKKYLQCSKKKCWPSVGPSLTHSSAPVVSRQNRITLSRTCSRLCSPPVQRTERCSKPFTRTRSLSPIWACASSALRGTTRPSTWRLWQTPLSSRTSRSVMARRCYPLLQVQLLLQPQGLRGIR